MELERLTKYEITCLIGVRAQQLENGAEPTIEVKGMTDAMKIAEKEFQERKIPLVVVRKMPDGSKVFVNID